MLLEDSTMVWSLKIRELQFAKDLPAFSLTLNIYEAGVNCTSKQNLEGSAKHSQTDIIYGARRTFQQTENSGIEWVF